jgi:hypothetical protein
MAYNEYADNVLPKMKRAYFRKCQEVEVSSFLLFLHIGRHEDA